MSTDKLVREQLSRLVSWADELSELQALDSFPERWPLSILLKVTALSRAVTA